MGSLAHLTNEISEADIKRKGAAEIICRLTYLIESTPSGKKIPNATASRILDECQVLKYRSIVSMSNKRIFSLEFNIYLLYNLFCYSNKSKNT